MKEKNLLESENKIEQLGSWVETGFNSKAIAVYGTTSEIMKKIVNSGEIPSLPLTDSIDYQREIINSGSNLYYAFPIIENLQHLDYPQAERIIVHLGKQRGVVQLVREQINSALPEYSDLPSQLHVPSDLLLKEVQENAKFYALSKSIYDVFVQSTGLEASPEDILAVTLSKWPEKFEEFQKSCPLVPFSSKASILEESNPVVVKKILDYLAKNPHILPAWLDFQGVLIYFNLDLFKLGKVKLGVEDETEIMILSDQLLSSNVISGIEVLSDADKQILY